MSAIGVRNVLSQVAVGWGEGDGEGLREGPGGSGTKPVGVNVYNGNGRKYTRML